jgi:uncharacterized protein
MKYKSVSVIDYWILKPFFTNQPYNLSLYSPASIIAWSNHPFQTYYAIEQDILFIAGHMEERNDSRHLILPISQKAFMSPEELYESALKNGYERYWYVPGDYLDKLDRKALDSHFILEEQKEYEDYIYLTEDLIQLRGNKYSKKRNLIHQFSREYLQNDRVRTEVILQESIDECLQFLEIWCEQHECNGDEENNGLACEKKALITTLKHIDHFESKGILVRVDGRVSAFGIGSRLNETTAVLNFEKADSGIKGLYQYLDNECAKRLFKGFRYINKESDMNIPNLAESKQSYNPISRVKSFILHLR